MHANEREYGKSFGKPFACIRVHSRFAFLAALGVMVSLSRAAETNDAAGISGHIWAPGGAPAKGVPVSVINVESKHSFPGKSDAEGRFFIAGIEPGSYIVQASGEDQNYLGRKKVRVAPGMVTSNIDLKSGALVLSGTARDEGGKGMEGAFVTAVKTDFGDTEFLPTASLRAANTDNEGHFELRGLLPGRYTVTVAGPGRGIRIFTNTLVTADTRLDVVFENTSVIAGRVLDPSGAPLPNANIQVFRVDRAPAIHCFALTDDDGKYQVRTLGLGRYDVIAAAGDFQTGVKSGVAVKAGATNVMDDIKLTTGGGAIVGSVTYGKSPLPAVIIARSTSSSLEVMSRADEEGKYTLTHLPDGDYMINFSDPTGEPEPVTIKDGATVTLNYSYYSAE